MKRCLILCILYLSTCLFAEGLDPSLIDLTRTGVQNEVPDPLVSISIVSDAVSTQQTGTIVVPVKLQIAPGWHIYWKNPGKIGLATRLSWEVPEGVYVEELLWPTPEWFEALEVVNFGYSNEVIFLQRMQIKEPLEDPLRIKVRADWLACENSCIPGDSEDEALIPNNQKGDDSFVKAAMAKIPKAWTGLEVLPAPEGLIAKLTLPTQNPVGSKVTFFSDVADLISPADGIGQVTQVESEGTLHIAFPHLSQMESLTGVLLINGNAYAVDLGITSLSSLELTGDHAFLFALLFAFVGGMILNLMPCVLPVISIKVMSFVKLAEGSRKESFKHGLIFTLGVLSSFWVLAGIAIGFQASGEALGWGFQLQNPWFVACLAVILFIMSLSLFGVFELGTSAISLGSKGNLGGYLNSFLTGGLATLVATPCTGPFLGTAIGYATTLGTLSTMVFFTCLGLGMALPYLFLSLFPKLMGWIPKAGGWMIGFKQLMGFFLLGTALWLLWVLESLMAEVEITNLLAALFIIAFGCWVYGYYAHPLRSRWLRRIGSLSAISIIAWGGYFGYQQLTPTKELTVWKPFSPELLRELRAKGEPVFIDFTAKWCLLCQANHYSLTTAKVDKAFRERGIHRLVADWTQHDPDITKALRKYGRNGVPLYLLFGEEEEPQILPQTLTPAIVLESLETVPKK